MSSRSLKSIRGNYDHSTLELCSMHSIITDQMVLAHNEGAPPITLVEFAIALAVFVLIYLIPVFIALIRRHKSKLGITIVSLVFGWTVIGWVAALVWSLTPAD